MSLVSDTGCAPCEARQASLLEWANGRGRNLLLFAIAALALFAIAPHIHANP